MSYARVDLTIEDDTSPDKHWYEITTYWSEHDVKFGRGHDGVAYSLAADDHKVLYWESNDAVVPDDIIEATDWQFKAEHMAARDAQTTAFLTEYRERMANHVPSDEEMFEMRAAFGPGEEVVNVITGQRYRT